MDDRVEQVVDITQVCLEKQTLRNIVSFLAIFPSFSSKGAISCQSFYWLFIVDSCIWLGPLSYLLIRATKWTLSWRTGSASRISQFLILRFWSHILQVLSSGRSYLILVLRTGTELQFCVAIVIHRSHKSYVDVSTLKWSSLIHICSSFPKAASNCEFALVLFLVAAHYLIFLRNPSDSFQSEQWRWRVPFSTYAPV